MIAEYVLIEHSDVKNLSSSVTDYLKMGWKPYGNPIVSVPEYSHGRKYAQAMIKETFIPGYTGPR